MVIVPQSSLTCLLMIMTCARWEYEMRKCGHFMLCCNPLHAGITTLFLMATLFVLDAQITLSKCFYGAHLSFPFPAYSDIYIPFLRFTFMESRI